VGSLLRLEPLGSVARCARAGSVGSLLRLETFRLLGNLLGSVGSLLRRIIRSRIIQATVSSLSARVSRIITLLRRSIRSRIQATFSSLSARVSRIITLLRRSIRSRIQATVSSLKLDEPCFLFIILAIFCILITYYIRFSYILITYYFYIYIYNTLSKVLRVLDFFLSVC
jgi:hypothetical protein